MTRKRPLSDRWAWDYIYETAVSCEGELEIVALGPLTNIAIAVLKYPNLTKYIKRVYIMGGAASWGNVTPYAEFNIHQDAHAASIVLSAGFKELILVDLDSTATAFLTDNECDRMLIQKSRLAPLYETIRKYQRRQLKEYLAEYPALEEDMKGKNIFYDAVAAAVAVNRDIAVVEPYYITCETQGESNYGRLIVDWNGRFSRKPNVSLVRSVDRERFAAIFFEALNSYLKPSSTGNAMQEERV